ncbi:MAG: hypothetical protein J5I50_00515 [Chitinophagaceae bacterium]|nr:hypothetical protein [Chitinophagaceae bacterium]
MKTVQEKLYHFEETPPADMWDAISEKLDSGKVVQMHKRNRVRTIALLTAVAAAVVLLLINFVFVSNNSDPQTVQTASTTGITTPATNIEKNNEVLENIINAPVNQKLLAGKLDSGQQYLIVSGPEGEPVRISPKAATLILSADGEFPPKPKWNKQVDQWQKIMLNNNMSSSPVGLMEMLMEMSEYEGNH